VPFESEKAVVDDYLAIESLRLGDRLRVEMQIDLATAGARVPPMLLQTLVENAVKHGIAELRDGGTLSIQARIENGAMLLMVDNPTPSPEERTRSMEANNGIGLANATERLRLLFGDEARLEMDLSQPRRATARVRVPQRP
jgi:LytS/YehU family sensor histidine kinase